METLATIAYFGFIIKRLTSYKEGLSIIDPFCVSSHYEMVSNLLIAYHYLMKRIVAEYFLLNEATNEFSLFLLNDYSIPPSLS